LYNQGSNTWSAPKRWPIEDGQLTANALTTGDLNRDGRTDLILLSENHVYRLLQKPDHTLDEPEKIPFSGSVKSVQVVDIDGDGRPDLLAADPENGQISLFLQQKDGSLGPPRTFPTLAGISELAVADWNGDGKPEIFILSADERQVGLTHLDEKKRLAFPTL